MLSWQESRHAIDLRTLASELAKLRSAMKEESEGRSDEDQAVGQIAAAQGAADAKDGPTVLRHLSEAGKWALKIAEKIGVGVATEALKRAVLP